MHVSTLMDASGLSAAIKSVLRATGGEGGVSLHIQEGEMVASARAPFAMAAMDAGRCDCPIDAQLHLSAEDGWRAARVLAHRTESLRWGDELAIFGSDGAEIYASLAKSLHDDAPELLEIPRRPPTRIADGSLLHAVLASLSAKQAENVLLSTARGRLQVEVGSKLCADLPCAGPNLDVRLNAALLRQWTATIPKEGGVEIWPPLTSYCILFRCPQAGSVFGLAPIA